jgi:hypothetical protein
MLKFFSNKKQNCAHHKLGWSQQLTTLSGVVPSKNLCNNGCFLKYFFTWKYIKIIYIFFIFKNLFLTSAYQNDLKTLKKLNYSKKKFNFSKIFSKYKIKRTLNIYFKTQSATSPRTIKVIVHRIDYHRSIFSHYIRQQE